MAHKSTQTNQAPSIRSKQYQLISLVGELERQLTLVPLRQRLSPPSKERPRVKSISTRVRAPSQTPVNRCQRLTVLGADTLTRRRSSFRRPLDNASDRHREHARAIARSASALERRADQLAPKGASQRARSWPASEPIKEAAAASSRKASEAGDRPRGPKGARSASLARAANGHAPTSRPTNKLPATSIDRGSAIESGGNKRPPRDAGRTACWPQANRRNSRRGAKRLAASLRLLLAPNGASESRPSDRRHEPAAGAERRPTRAAVLSLRSPRASGHQPPHRPVGPARATATSGAHATQTCRPKTGDFRPFLSAGRRARRAARLAQRETARDLAGAGSRAAAARASTSSPPLISEAAMKARAASARIVAAPRVAIKRRLQNGAATIKPAS